MVKVIALGHGNYVVNHGHFENQPALFMEAVDKLDQNAITRGAVITFGNVESARALRDELTLAINLFAEAARK